MIFRQIHMNYEAIPPFSERKARPKVIGIPKLFLMPRFVTSAWRRGILVDEWILGSHQQMPMTGENLRTKNGGFLENSHLQYGGLSETNHFFQWIKWVDSPLPGYVIDRSLGVLSVAICQVPWESHVR